MKKASYADLRTNWLLLSNVLLGSFLGGSAVRIFIVAMPTIANSLGATVLGLSWALLAYHLSNIGLSLVFGRVGDIYGRHRIYGTGYLVMVIGSFLCGLSTTISQLIGFRILQGVGAAMTQSVGRALAAEAMPGEKGGKAQGLMTTAFHAGFLLGPSIGGLIIDYMGWRWSFFLLVPFGALGAFLTFPNMARLVVPAGHPRVDYLGATLLVASATTLILLVDRRSMEVLGPGLRIFLTLLLIGCFFAFLLREGSTPSPIVNLSLFKNRMFTFSTLSLLVVAINYSLTNFLLPFYLQGVLQLSPSFMGVLFMAAPIFTVSLGPVSGHISDRVGPRLPATTGVALLTAAVLLGSILQTDSHWILPTFMLALLGVANGLFNPANSVGMINSVPKEHMGFASGALNVMFSLGNIFGISLGGLLMTTAFQIHTGSPGAAPTPTNPTAFVAALNYTYRVATGISFIAMVTSAMRGTRSTK
ncbi:MAG: MFS transporter [Candidatus Binatia bacterium]